jgi:hypothetical protein
MKNKPVKKEQGNEDEDEHEKPNKGTSEPLIDLNTGLQRA